MSAVDSSRPLAGRGAFVTGASAGIGRAVALDLAAGGATVALVARRAERLEELAAEIAAAGGEAFAVPADVADPAALAAAWDVAGIQLGGAPTAVIVNAGRGLGGGVLSSDDAEWESIFTLNALGALRLMRLAAAALKELPGDAGPRDVVLLGSVVGTNVSPFSAVYGATKFAAEAAAEGLRREVGSSGVRVTTVKPGIVASEFQAEAGYTDEMFAGLVEKFGGVLQPEDVARVVRFAVTQPVGVHVSPLTVRPTGQDYP